MVIVLYMIYYVQLVCLISALIYAQSSMNFAKFHFLQNIAKVNFTNAESTRCMFRDVDKYFFL